MGKKLAIKGHATRDKEVIELLEMLGGVAVSAGGAVESYCYYIAEDSATKYIFWDYIGPEEIDKYHIFTLEEFLEKYPYKVGDKILDNYGDALTVKSMEWSEDCETMVYDFKDSVVVLAAEDMKPANNMTNETITPAPDITANVIDKNNCSIQCPDGYEFYDENGKLIGTTVMMRPKKLKYPDNYEECVRIAKNIHGYDIHIDAPAYRGLMESFIKLLICRDAYWKLAGDELRLGKPWKPDWLDETTKYGVWPYQNVIIKDNVIRTNSALVFPTPEIRDTFHKNFKDLIESCKELL